MSPSQSLTRLFCIGDYAEVIVIDAQDLNVLFTLSSRVEPDWINAVTIVRTQALHGNYFIKIETYLLKM